MAVNTFRSTRPLTEEENKKVTELWEEYFEKTIRPSALRAKRTFCASYEVEDLYSEAFVCLLSVLGLNGTSGKFDPDRKGATFKTYFTTALFNWFRDLGTAHKMRTSKVSLNEQIEEYSQPDRDETSENESFDLVYRTLWNQLGALARAVLDIQWISYPKRVPLTNIARLFELPYEQVLLANQELKKKLKQIRYNESNEISDQLEQDCFGKFPDPSCSECQGCVDLHLCQKVGVVQIGQFDRFPKKERFMSEETAVSTPATQSAKPVKMTMMDIAFARLIQGPQSKEEMVAAIQTQYPENRGTRVTDLINILNRKNLLTTQDEEVLVGEGEAAQKTKVRKYVLSSNALAELSASGELKEKTLEDGTTFWHLAISVPAPKKATEAPQAEAPQAEAPQAEVSIEQQYQPQEVQA